MKFFRNKYLCALIVLTVCCVIGFEGSAIPRLELMYVDSKKPHTVVEKLPDRIIQDIVARLRLSVSDGLAHASNLPPVDMMAPSDELKMSWARLKGREDAIFLNLSGDVLGNSSVLPSEPAPVIVGKHDEATNTGELSVMRMRMVNGEMKAEVLRLHPTDFQSHWTMHIRNFAWLEWTHANAACDSAAWQSKWLNSVAIPTTPLETIRTAFLSYDMGNAASPSPLVLGGDQATINRSNGYWHQRANNEPCWTHRALKDFDDGSGVFRNISLDGFLNLTSLAQEIHGAPVSYIATPNIRQTVNTSTKKSFFKKTVTTHVEYHLKPNWIVGTKLPNAAVAAGASYEQSYNPWWSTEHIYGFTKAVGNHTLPQEEFVVYDWKQKKSGWTGIFVFLVIVVLFVLALATAGVAFTSTLGTSGFQGALAGLAVGSIAGLIATGGSPTTNTTAWFTPFSKSSYQLAPLPPPGDALTVGNETRSKWIAAPDEATPGGFSSHIGTINFKRALACGGASKSTPACVAPAVSTLSMNDTRFNQVFSDMFWFPSQFLQKHKQPFER